MSEKRIVRMVEATYRSGLSRRTIYHMIKAGKFPKPVKIGPRAIGWPADEFDAWFSVLWRKKYPVNAQELAELKKNWENYKELTDGGAWKQARLQRTYPKLWALSETYLDARSAINSELCMMELESDKGKDSYD